MRLTFTAKPPKLTRKQRKLVVTIEAPKGKRTIVVTKERKGSK
jgi:hypothetical protein